MDDDKKFLARAVDIATASIERGGGPFGALIVTANGDVYEGQDTVLTSNDPTAHAEVAAIRAASSGEERFELSGSTLYSSCEPCPMCLTAALWARIPRIIYAATSDRAAAAGFDDANFYRQLSEGISSVTDARVEHCPLANADQPFDAWEAYEGRVEF